MIKIFDSGKFKRRAFIFGLLFIFVQTYSVRIDAQTRRKAAAHTAKKKVAAKRQLPAKDNEKDLSSLVKVTQIDEIALKGLIKRGENAKPLLVNFWATWCDPCREEFPDLVKLDAEYKGKIDLITISLDDLAEIKRDVPKFLAQMNAEMPSYLLKALDDEAAIASVSKNWQGGLPFTILFNGKGETVYFIQGKFKTELLRAEVEKTLANQSQVTSIQMLELPRRDFFSELTYEKGKANAGNDIAEGKFIIRRYGLTPGIAPESLKKLKETYGIEYIEHGCVVTNNLVEYVKGYNEVSKAEIKRKFGLDF
jgi:thiol-disulfide isomerase/thioredoxin